MSTFDGNVKEFPRIRIDFFRSNPSCPPPVACFLSHVHSDHLQGLESLKSPFVYCSHATRRLLLTLEKYPHRMNFAKGILESRVQTYKHLKTVLRPIPLETPTEIELSPIDKIRVTLFDANHCPGAVMFLIEGNDRAILYTGDVRAEPWWVNQIIRNPLLMPYAIGHAVLDCVYLDTTFAVKNDVYKEFPSKASGLSELLTKVSKYPPDTPFYFRAWTLGYEEVWVALSSFLRSQVHVDEYQWRLYSSMTGLHGISDALAGFQFGNQKHPGCFDLDRGQRIHSCEPGTKCHAELSKQNIVWISPIITRTKDGQDVLELGAGGGGGDLYQVPLLEVPDIAAMRNLEQLLSARIEDSELRAAILERIISARSAGETRVTLDGLDKDVYEDIPITELAKLMSNARQWSKKSTATSKAALNGLPDTIRFPYSRHSSYSELCNLVLSLKPKDVHPCTVDVDTWSEEVSMSYLFGHCCSERLFPYDEKMRELVQNRAENDRMGKKRKYQANESTQSDEGEQSSQTRSFQTANEASQANNKAVDLVAVPAVVDDTREVSKSPPTKTTMLPLSQTSPEASLQKKSELPLQQRSEAPPQETAAEPTKKESRHHLSKKQKKVRKLQKNMANAPNSGIRWIDAPCFSCSEFSSDEDDHLLNTVHPQRSGPESQQTDPDSMPLSAFDSQNFISSQSDPQQIPNPSRTWSDSDEDSLDLGSDVGHYDHDWDPPGATPPKEPRERRTKSKRLRDRRRAYEAAREMLEDPESREWGDWRPVTVSSSVGGGGSRSGGAGKGEGDNEKGAEDGGGEVEL